MRYVNLKENHSPEGKLYCFSHAGGSALTYKNWEQDVPNSFNIDICVIELPNRMFPFESSTEDTFEDYINEIAKFISQDYSFRPFGFFGQSMGGFLAFEIASILEGKLESKLCWLGISSCAPTYFLKSNRSRHDKYKLTDEEFIEYLIKLDEDQGLLFKAEEFRKLFLPVVRQDVKLLETHKFPSVETKISTPISVFIGNNDSTINLNEANLWKYNTSKAFQMFIYDGGHNLVKSNDNSLKEDVFYSFMKECRKFYLD